MTSGSSGWIGHARRLPYRRTASILLALVAATFLAAVLSADEEDPRPLGAAQRIAIGGRPILIEAGLGSIWVASRDGKVVTKVDPVGVHVAARIAVPEGVADLALGADALWVVTARGSLLRIDPTKGVIRRRVTNDADDGGPLAVAGQTVWVVLGDVPRLTRVNGASGELLANTPLPEVPADVAATSDRVLVALPRTNRVARIDRNTNAVIESATVRGRPSSLLATPAALWVGVDDEHAIFATSLRRGTATRARVPSRPARETAPASFKALAACPGRETIFVRTQETLSQVDPQTFRTTEQRRAPSWRQRSGLACGYGAVWLSDPAAGDLLRIGLDELTG